MDFLNNIKVGKKLIGSFLIVVIIMVIVGLVGLSGVNTINSYVDAMYGDQLIPINKLDTMNQQIWEIRGNTVGYYTLPDTRDNMRTQTDALIEALDKNISAYQSLITDDSEKEIYSELTDSWNKYKNAVETFYAVVDSGDNKAAIVSMTSGDLVTQRKAASDTLQKLVDINLKEANDYSLAGNTELANVTLQIIITIIIGAILAFSLGFIISRSISVPISKAANIMRELSLGHFGNRLKLNRKDEIGEMAVAMDKFADDLQFDIISGMKQIAEGDISISLTPKDEKDEIAPAFNTLVGAINSIVGEVNTLIYTAEEGNLKQRGDPAKFHGVYKEIIIGINEMLDAIVIPLREVLRVSELFAHAKFSARFDENVAIKGDLIALKNGLNTVGMELSKAIQDISVQVGSLSASSEEAAASVEEITAGATSIAQSSSVVSANAETSVNSVDQVLTAMEELNTSVSTVATKVESVSRLSQQANITSTNGVEQAAIAENGIKAINEAVNDVGKIITEIKGQMNEIGKIVEIIGDIADQTNLLALNAAIEAARAGDAGMGFAVVANEVKVLAQESQGSAENIGKIISSLQNQSERAASAMNQATSEVAKGSIAINDTIKFFHNIAGQVEEISQHMTEVASLSEEEAAAVEEITASVSEVKSLAVETAKEAIGSSSASEESSAALNQVSTVVTNLSVIATRIDESMSRLNG